MPEYKDVCAGPETLTREDRLKIIARIHSLLYWVGEIIPQEIVLEGRTVPLRAAVFNYLITDEPTAEQKKDAEVLGEMLDAKVREIESEIRTGDVGRSEACDLMNEARAFLRAVDELRNAEGEEGELRRHDLMKKIEDAKRWQHFVKEST